MKKTDKQMTVLGGLKDQSPKFSTGYAMKPKESNVTRTSVAPTPKTLGGRNA